MFFFPPRAAHLPVIVGRRRAVFVYCVAYWRLCSPLHCTLTLHTKIAASLPVGLFNCLPASVCVCLCTIVQTCLCVFLNVCRQASLYVSLYVCLFVYLFVCLPICPYAGSPVCLLTCLHAFIPTFAKQTYIIFKLNSVYHWHCIFVLTLQIMFLFRNLVLII